MRNILKHAKNTLLAPIGDKFSIFLVSLQLFAYFIGTNSISDAIVTLSFLYLNALIETIQNIRNEKEIDSFKEFFKIKAKIHTSDGLKLTENVKIGDIVYLTIGDRIPGDGIMIKQTKYTSTKQICVDESLLTGESENIIKKEGEITWEESHIFNKSFRKRKILTRKDISLGKTKSVREELESNDGFFPGKTIMRTSTESADGNEKLGEVCLNSLNTSEEDAIKNIRRISEKYFDKNSKVKNSNLNKFGIKVESVSTLDRSNNLSQINETFNGNSNDEKLQEIVKKINFEVKNSKHALTAGSYVTQGTCMALITNEGKFIKEIETNLGEINSEMTGKVEKIQKSLFLGILTACFALFIYCSLQNRNALEIAVSLAVTAIPEGLELIVRINLSVITLRLKKDKIFVKNLLALEKVGNISLIVFDKTGTLTNNTQHINSCYIFDKCADSQSGHSENDLSFMKRVEVTENALLSAICGHLNDIITIDNKEIGNQIDMSMKRAAASENSELLHFIPFCTENMFTRGVIKLDEQIYEIIKGAPEQVINFCDKFENGVQISADDRNVIVSGLKMRSVAICYRKSLDFNSNNFEESRSNLGADFTLFALITFKNDLRTGVKECLDKFSQDNTKLCILTGDAEITTKELLNGINIPAEFSSATDFITNNALDFKKNVLKVIYRASPYQKHEIIKLFQKTEKILMAGDGINDLLAIKQADVGVSLGDGSDLSKEISEVVLTDSNISNILILEQSGKLAYHNITAVLKYLISSNIGEVIAVTMALLNHKNILNSRQLLFINVLTDGLPATFLCMNLKFSKGNFLVIRSLIIAIFIGFVTYLIDDPTKSFIFIVVAEMMNSLTNISLKDSLFASYSYNKTLVLIVGLILLFFPAMINSVIFQNLLQIQGISPGEYFKIILGSTGVILIDEVFKLL